MEATLLRKHPSRGKGMMEDLLKKGNIGIESEGPFYKSLFASLQELVVLR